MSLIDTHCHLTSKALFGDLFGVCQRARAAGVARMITVATDAADSRRAIAAADHYRGVSATVGIHPHEAAKVKAGDWQLLRELRHNPNVVAWGEIGLDYHYDFSDPLTQRRVFARQLELATARDLPAIIHCREAMSDTVGLLVDHGFGRRRVVDQLSGDGIARRGHRKQWHPGRHHSTTLKLYQMVSLRNSNVETTQ